MRTLTIILTLVLLEIQSVTALPPTGLLLTGKAKKETDTTQVNYFIRKALSFVHVLAREVSYKPTDAEKIKEYVDSAELICTKNQIEFPAMLYLARAEYFFAKTDMVNAKKEAEVALKISEKIKDNFSMARVFTFLGKLSLKSGLYSESIKYYDASTELAKKYHLHGFIARNFNGIADVHYVLGNMKDYLKYLKLVIDAGYEENDIGHIEDGLFMLGTIHTDFQRNFKLADSILNKCLEIALIRRDTSYASLALANLGWNFYKEKQYDSAIKNYNKSLVLSLNGKRYSYAANSLGNLGTIYRDLDDNKNAIKYYKYSIEQANKINDLTDLSWVYNDMSEMYIRMKDTANAYKTYVKFKTYSDSLMKFKSFQGLSDARAKYEADAHNKEVELLSLKLGNQRLLIYGYTGLFILSIIIGILFYSRSRINAKRRLSEMNRKIAEVTQANLRQQMNPHFIFNTLNSIQYFMYQHDKLSTNNYLTKFSNLIRKILENSQHTSVPLRDELDALSLYLELETVRFKDKFDYIIKVDEEIDTILYKVPTMLIQPYVENSICHGLMPLQQKGLIKIDLRLEKEYIACTIEDNGIGRKAAEESKTKSQNNHSSLGTQIVSSRLDLVNVLYGTSLKTSYTDLMNLNGDPAGTRVEIQIPIMT